MNTLENIQKTSLVFFVSFGLAHIISGLITSPFANTVHDTLDIPFALSGLLYGGASLKLSLASSKKTNTMLNAVIGIGIIVAIIALIYINFFIPNLNG